MDIDIGSSVVAYNTVSLAIGYAKGLVVDMGFCVQVRCELGGRGRGVGGVGGGVGVGAGIVVGVAAGSVTCSVWVLF